MNRHIDLVDMCKDTGKGVVVYSADFDDPGNWVRNDYEGFIRSVSANKRKNLLAPHTLEEIKEKNWQTYKLVWGNMGFALQTDEEGNVWVHWLHNSEPNCTGVGKILIKKAIELGATHLFNVDTPYLNALYESYGFKEYCRQPFLETLTHIYRKRIP